jgi:hypothetical protein
VLANPKLMSISFSNDTASVVTALDSFVGTVGNTSYWTATTSEYGVGVPTVATPVHLAEAAPTNITDNGVQSWLKAKIAANAFGAATSSTLYVIFYPSSTTIDYHGLISCQSFGGYHGSVTLPGNMPVAYAVVPRCTSFGGMTQMQTTTTSTSHEIIEAVTDPYTESDPAYQHVDLDHIIWEMMLIGEVGDLCAQDPEADYTPAGYSFMVQRTWSNKAAAAGKDPCQPSLPNDVYFNSVPVMNDSVPFLFQGQQTGLTTKGVHIPLNTSKTIDVNLFSEGPTGGPWNVFAQPATQGTLNFSWNKSSGSNGDVLHLTITALAHEQSTGGAAFFIISQRGNTQRMYLGFVN